jgi:hypothetical protein
MADEQTVAAEEEAFGKWLADLEGDEDEETEDEEVPVVERLEKKVDTLVKEKQTEEIIDKFMAGASEDAKRLFGIYRRGDEDPKQLKAIMELAVVKAGEAAPASEEVEEQAEKKATQMARDAYGVGPISGGQAASGEMTAEQYFDSLRERTRKGDMHAAFEAWNKLPPESEASKE